MKRTTYLKFASLVLLVLLLGIYIGYSAIPSTPVWISSGIYPRADYTFFKEGATFFAKSIYGQILASSVNFTNLVTTYLASDKSYFIASGEYIVDSPIVLVSDIHVFADPYSTSLKVKANTDFGTATGILMGTSLENIAISGLILDGNKANQAVTGYQRGLILMNSSNILITKVKAINSVFTGFDLMGCNGVVISDCFAISNGKSNGVLTFGNGFYVRNSGSRDSQNITITNSQAFGNGDATSGDGAGFAFFGKGHITLSNSISILNKRYGIKSQCGNLTVSNCDVSHNLFGVSVSTGFDSNTTQISNIRAINCSSYGIYLTAPATVTGGIVGDCGTGLRAEAGSGAFDGIIINGLSAYGSTNNGIDVKGINHTVISNSLAWDNTGSGIVFDDYGATALYWGQVIGCNAWNNGAYGMRENAGASVDYNMVIGCNFEGNTYDGIPLDGANSKVFNCWNGTHWQDDT